MGKKVGDPIFHLVENPSKILQHCLKDNDDKGIELEKVKVPHEAHHLVIERCYYDGFILTASNRKSSRFSISQTQPTIQDNIVQEICLKYGANPIENCPIHFSVGTIQQWINKHVTKTEAKRLFSKLNDAKQIGPYDKIF